MLRELKAWILGMLVLAAVSSASAFSLNGPVDAEDWQQIVIGYAQTAGDNWYGVDVAGPMNLGEEYRWNTPVLYYAFDANFLDYFGANGVESVEQAINILNGVTNVDVQPLTDFPLDTTRNNARAAALGLFDLKTATLSAMLEELGLANAERWTWCLHDRLVTTPPPCPGLVTYQTIKRNFDPITFEPSSYVNGALFTYTIVEICQGPPAILADAYEYPVDPLSPSSSIAASGLLSAWVSAGAFFTGLTRDDFGGLRYLWRTNNMNVETVDAAATLIATTATNGSTLSVITTSNLTQLVQASLTNPPAQLQALFPDIVISDFTSSFQLVVSSNLVGYFTNFPGSTVGSPASLVTTLVFTTNVQQQFNYSFANVVTNPFFFNGTFTNRAPFTNRTVIVITTNVGFPPGSTVGSPPVTTFTTRTLTENIINGDYFIIPTNICNFEVLSNLFTQVTGVTNTVIADTTGATNVDGQSFSQTTVSFFTNRFLLVRQTPCSTNAMVRPGIKGLRFVRRSYDSLLGQFFEPVTTNYTLAAVIGNQAFTETYRRTVNRPDFLFTAEDLAGTPGNNTIEFSLFGRSVPQFVPNGSSLAGPGIIQAQGDAQTVITYNKVGPIFQNQSPNFMDEAGALTVLAYFIWGSFDGTTNAPIAHPNGTSIQNLENQVLMQISPNSLPDGTAGVFYSAQMSALGGQPQHTFSLSPGSPALPPGLTLSSSGLISGTLTQADTFDFNVRLSDSSGRVIDRAFSITISPSP